MANDEQEDVEKSRKVERCYVNAGGEKSFRPWADTVAVSHKFKGGYELLMPLKELQDAQRVQGLAFGISQVVGNAYGGEKVEEDAIEKAEKRWETISGGKWASEREATGMRSSDILDAYVAAHAAAGNKISDEKRNEILAGLENGDVKSKDLLANEAIAAQYHEIKHKRALERYEKAKVKASTATAALPTL